MRRPNALLVAVAIVAVGVFLAERPPADPSPVRLSAAEQAQRDAVLDTEVSFAVGGELLGNVLDRIARERQLPLGRARYESEDWRWTVQRLEIRHPIRLRSALGLLGLEAGPWREGKLWVAPLKRSVAILPAWDQASRALLPKTTWDDVEGKIDIRDMRFIAPGPAQLFVAIDNHARIAALTSLLARVRETLDQHFEPCRAGDSVDGQWRARLHAALQDDDIPDRLWSLAALRTAIERRTHLNVCIQGVSLEAENELRRPLTPWRTTEELLDSFCGRHHLVWRAEHDVLAIHASDAWPAGEFGWLHTWRVHAVDFVAPGCGAADDPAQTLLDMLTYAPREFDGAIWLPACQGSQRGALVVSADSADQQSVARLIATLATLQASASEDLAGERHVFVQQPHVWNTPVFRVAATEWEAPRPLWLERKAPRSLAGVNYADLTPLAWSKAPPDALGRRVGLRAVSRQARPGWRPF